MSKTLPVELATVQYGSPNQIVEIAFRVFGGKDHFERIEAVHEVLEDYTAYFSETEKTVVSVDSYQTEAQRTDDGVAYVLFTFGNFQDVPDFFNPANYPTT